jgi:hypothetical protein
MPRQTASASEYTSVVRSSAVANDVASKPAGSPAAAKAAGAAVRGGGGLGSLGAIGAIVKQSTVARSIAPPVVQTGSSAPPLLPLQLSGGTTDAFVVAYSSSGTALWTAKITSGGPDVAYSVTVDSDGNIYVTGIGGHNIVNSTISVFNANGTPFATTLSNLIYGDAFVVKYNTNGSVQWIARIGSPDIEAGVEITTDSNNNVYVLGKSGSGVTTTAYNANGTPFSTTLPDAGLGDAFLAKYNSSGFVQWIARVGSPASELSDFTTGGIRIDPSGNVYIGIAGGSGQVLTAYNANGASFATTLTNSGDIDTYIIKYNASGVVQWVTKIGGGGSDFPFGLATDSNGNVYVGGVYDGNTTLTLYNSDKTSFATTMPNSFHANGYIAKYNSSGFVQWGAYIGGVSATGDTVYAVCTDSSGNLYVTGSYNSGCPIRNFDGTEYLTMDASAGGNAYVAKYNPNGYVQWVGRLNSLTAPWGISVDSTGIYVVGETNGAMRAFSANGTASGTLFGKTLTNRGNNDAFIVKFNTNGAVQWLTSIAGTASDVARSVTVDNSGKLYVSGSFGSSQLTAFSA